MVPPCAAALAMGSLVATAMPPMPGGIVRAYDNPDIKAFRGSPLSSPKRHNNRLPGNGLRNMPATNLLDQIEKRFGELTKTQKIIANHILQNPLGAAFSTVEQMAGACGTSSASIVRLSNFFGYSGFAELQHELRNLLNTFTPANRLLNSFDKLSRNENIVDDIAAIQMDNLRTTYDHISEPELRQATRAIRKAKKIYVAGSRSCHAPAHYLAYNLDRILGNCDFLDPSDCLFPDKISRFKQGDAFIVITLPRYINSVVQACQVAREQGLYILAITDSYLSPLANFSDNTICVDCKSYDFHNSILSIIFVAELLISLVTAENTGAAKKTLGGIEALLQRFNIHDNMNYHMNMVAFMNDEADGTKPPAPGKTFKND